MKYYYKKSKRINKREDKYKKTNQVYIWQYDEDFPENKNKPENNYILIRVSVEKHKKLLSIYFGIDYDSLNICHNKIMQKLAYKIEEEKIADKYINTKTGEVNNLLKARLKREYNKLAAKEIINIDKSISNIDKSISSLCAEKQLIETQNRDLTAENDDLKDFKERALKEVKEKAECIRTVKDAILSLMREKDKLADKYRSNLIWSFFWYITSCVLLFPALSVFMGGV